MEEGHVIVRSHLRGLHHPESVCGEKRLLQEGTTRKGGKTAGLLLAAGTSTRMGRPKQLLALGDETLLDRLLAAALDSELGVVVLVLGFLALEIQEALKTDLHHPKLQIVENRRYAEGLSTSIVAGLSRVEGACDHVMIILADMPLVTTSLINELLRHYLASRLPLGAIKVKGRRSHPVIIGRRFFEEIRRLEGDTGARVLFEKYAEQVCLVEPKDPYDDVDLDTPGDYLDFKKSLQ